MQNFKDRIMQFRQEARAVITEIQKANKMDFSITDTLDRSDEYLKSDQFRNSTVTIIVDHPGYKNDEDVVYPFAIARERVYYITRDAWTGVVAVVDLPYESLAVLADFILEKYQTKTS